MSKNKITLAIISGLLVATAIPVHASNTVAFAVVDKANNGMFTQVGTPTGSLTPLKGFAKDLPLVSVMRQITPNGWKVKKVKTGDKSLNNDMLVSWEGGKSWIETLNSIIKSNPVNATVYWQEREIVLSPVIVEASSVKSNAIFELAGSNTSSANQISQEATPVTDGGSEAPTAVTEVAPVAEVAPVVEEVKPAPAPVVPVKNWDMVPSKSLKENVEVWGNKAGYRVVWLGEDYPIDDFRILTGDFDSYQGPIKQLADDYGPKSAVDKPLTFEFLQNATLVVKNYRFEQAGFPQINR